MSIVTIFENIYSDKPFYVTIAQALERIRTGKSKSKIEEIRAALDKDKADALKRSLPSVCFSGKFSKRTDENLIEHSGYLVLDFDNVAALDERAAQLHDNEFVYAYWLSPRGNGLKALVKIADGKKHREHFEALRDIFPDADKSGVNVSRVCYESYDASIQIKTDAKTFKTVKVIQRTAVTEIEQDYQNIFKKIEKWLANRGDAFVTGERNHYLFKLSSACCRFGIPEDVTKELVLREYHTDSDCKPSGYTKPVENGYKSNRNQAGTARFENERLVDKTTRREVEVTLDPDISDPLVRPRDVVYGAEVKEQAFELFQKGYEHITGIGITTLDYLFKPRKTELTLISGHGNAGKSSFKKWYQVLRALMFGEKFASFPPEDYPIANYYHDLTEIILGCECTPANTRNKPDMVIFNAVYDFVSQHFFYIYPTDLSPTPEYVKERFLELIIKEKVDGVDIDPFNQMTNDYGKVGGRDDKYLETVLADFGRFAQLNNVYFWIVAHPKAMQKNQSTQNYPCPDVFDLAGGAMWNNKMHNILIYHRPLAQTDPTNPTCELHTKKIKNQKIVGKRGDMMFEYNFHKRRFVFDGYDPMKSAAQKVFNIET